jgi:hypothetical protein
MFSHGDGPTGQPGRVENDRREYREYRKFRYVSPCDAMPLEDDLAGTSGVAEIAENKFYVAWSALHIACENCGNWFWPISPGSGKVRVHAAAGALLA